jgi:Ca2+-binding RTX toxin-like protein
MNVNGTVDSDGIPGNGIPLVGGVAADILNFNWSAGGDWMLGGAGNDIYNVNSIDDLVFEGPGNGTDTVVSRVDSYTLTNDVENLILDNTPTQLVVLPGPVFQLIPAADNGTGNGLNNVITGNDNNNTLSGLDGNDTLSGGNGNDTLTTSYGASGKFPGPTAAVGLYGRFRLGEKWYLSAGAGGMGATVENITISVVEAGTNLRYFINNRFGLEAGYGLTQVKFTIDKDGSGGLFDPSIQGSIKYPFQNIRIGVVAAFQ